MSENNAKIPDAAEPLCFAWYEFMGICRPEYELREKYNQFRKPKPNETQSETDLRIHQTAQKTHKLQLDFLAEIRNGNFFVFGRDVTDRIDSPYVELPNSLFEEANPSFKIDWEHNSITFNGRKVIDIQAAPKPHIALQKTLLVSEQEKATSKLTGIEPPVNRYPSKAGAKSYAHIREAAILECYRQHPDFGRWAFSKRLEYAQAAAQKEHPWFDASSGFNRSSYYATVKSLRQSGHIPSNNVHNQKK